MHRCAMGRFLVNSSSTVSLIPLNRGLGCNLTMIDNLEFTRNGGHLQFTAGYNATISNNLFQYFSRDDSPATMTFASYSQFCNPEDDHLQRFSVINNTFEYSGADLFDSVGIGGYSFEPFNRKQLYEVKGNYFNVRRCKYLF